MNGLAVGKISDIPRPTEIEGFTIGKIAEIDQDGDVFIDFSGNPQGPIKARITGAALEHLNRHSGRGLNVLIAFEENDIGRPVIIDVIHNRLEPAPNPKILDRENLDDISIDGESVTFEAKKQIVLRCGNASITLTSAGKILIRGAYLLNRSSGVNRIKGGSVQIN